MKPVKIRIFTPAGMRGGFSTDEWFKLPLKLRQRWWKETDYGKQSPSPELKAEIAAVINESQKP